MNIRNLLLTSMIFCAAPIVCAAPEVSLTSQEQEKIKQWAKKLRPGALQIIKAAVSVLKDEYIFALDKMHVGKSIAEFRQETLKNCKFFDAKWDDIVIKNKEYDKKYKRNKDHQYIVFMMPENPSLRIISFSSPLDDINCPGLSKLMSMCFYPEEVITEKHMTTMKRLVEIYSFTHDFLMTMVCDMPAEQEVKLTKEEQKVGLTKQEQKAVTEWVKKVKGFLPEAQQMIKTAIMVHKEALLSELSQTKVGSDYDFKASVKMFSSRWKDKIGALIKKLQLNLTPKKFEEVIKQFRFFRECPLNMLINSEDFLGLSWRRGKVVTEEDIETMKNLVALYSFALKCL